MFLWLLQPPCLCYRGRVRARTEWESVDAIPSRYRTVSNYELLATRHPALLITTTSFSYPVADFSLYMPSFGLRGACDFLRTGSHNRAPSCLLPLYLLMHPLPVSFCLFPDC